MATPEMVLPFNNCGLDKNAQDNERRTPLHDASHSGATAVTEALLSVNADRTLKNLSSRDPWVVAWQHGHAAIMLLLQNQAPTETAIADLNVSTQTSPYSHCGLLRSSTARI